MCWTFKSSASDSHPVECLNCRHDLSTIQTIARFCPGCGFKIQSHRKRFAIARLILPLIQLGRGNVMDCPDSTCRTAILAGYANAMYHLGWRYERGSGASINLPEAQRCYRKSARLGNLDAMVRLAADDLPS